MIDKIKDVYKKAFDYNNKIVFFPIRHHSPTCSYHLKTIIEEYKQNAI